MTDIIGGLLMMSGGGLMLGSALHLVRHPGPNAAELAASLPFTPLPVPDPALDELVASIS